MKKYFVDVTVDGLNGIDCKPFEVFEAYLNKGFIIVKTKDFYYNITFDNYLSDEDIEEIKELKEFKIDTLEYLLNYKARIMSEQLELSDKNINNFIDNYLYLIYSNLKEVSFNIQDFIC